MRVTRHPYEVEGWGVGELWIGDGRVVVAHDPPTPGVRLHGRWPESTPQSDPQTGPRGTPGVPTETLAGDRRRTLTGSWRSCSNRSTATSGRARLVRGRAARRRLGDAFPGGAGRDARNVPWGEVVSYGELSALAGRQRAARAAGTFCAENRFSLFVPCHRVVAAAGIGGYGSLGVDYKRRLLRLEGWTS